MPLFHTIAHPTDFDEPSKEAFRVARQLAQELGAKVVAFHFVPPPAVLTGDGRVMLDPNGGEPTDLWATYRALQADTPKVPVQYAVVVGDSSKAWYLLEEKVRELGEGVLIVMGSHGRRGLQRVLWGSKAEEVVRAFRGPVLVVKAPASDEASASETDTTVIADPLVIGG
jgi:nucleotide-binding universal stress UspA family protein